MLKPYGLHIETACNGLEAVEKIKENGNYDIVFMDHMMPVMDGVKAAKLIREWEIEQCNNGNSRTRIPIVALTANAVLGQKEMFLANGFDAFISKPIDLQIFDQVVKRFIKTVKQLDESELANKTIDFLKMEKIFISDAENAINVIGKLSKDISSLGTSTEPSNQRFVGEGSPLEGKDLESYIIAVHGIKSALNGIGEKALSDLAYKLEQAGKNGNYDLMANQTPVLMEGLLNLVKDFKSKETEEVRDVSQEISSEDMVFLREKLDEIKTACQIYDVKTAKKALADLKQKTLPHMVDDICDEISVNLLCGEFKKAADKIEIYMASSIA